MEEQVKETVDVASEVVAQGGTDIAPPAPKRPEDMTLEEKTIAAVEFLHQAIPQARTMVNSDNLTGVQAKRVLSALIESPLEQETSKFTTASAAKLFNLACLIQNAKYLLFQGAPTLLSEVEKRNAEELSAQQAQAEAQANLSANESNNNTIKEE